MMDRTNHTPTHHCRSPARGHSNSRQSNLSGARACRGADEQRLRNVVEAEYRRVVPDSDPPEVVRVDQEDEMARQLRSIALVFSIVAALSLVVGALGILNIGLATLRERGDEV